MYDWMTWRTVGFSKQWKILITVTTQDDTINPVGCIVPLCALLYFLYIEFWSRRLQLRQ
jgi:hypothetical protein